MMTPFLRHYPGQPAGAGLRARVSGPAAPSGSGRRVFAAWLGLFLLAWMVVAGSVLPVERARDSASGAAMAGFAQELLGDRIVICTAGGMVALDRNTGQILDDGPASVPGQDNPVPDSHGHGSLCLFCLPLLHAGLGGPAGAPAVVPPLGVALAARGHPAFAVVVPPVRLAGAAIPRAPPFSALSVS